MIVERRLDYVGEHGPDLCEAGCVVRCDLCRVGPMFQNVHQIVFWLHDPSTGARLEVQEITLCLECAQLLFAACDLVERGEAHKLGDQTLTLKTRTEQ
jgi:hypothetical protein